MATERQFDSLIEIVDDPPKNLPWLNRGKDEWRKEVSREEAGRLFLLVSTKEEGLNSSIERWGLAIPFNVYWGNDLASLMSDIGKCQIKKKEFRGKTVDLSDLTEMTAKLFEEPRFYPYMMATRMLIRRDNSSSEEFREVTRFSPLNTTALEARQEKKLGYSTETLEELKSRYQVLVKLFYPIAMRFAHRRARNYSEPADEWESIAGERLSVSAYNFYWETMAIDPKWTIQRFLIIVQRSLHDPMAETFDTHSLEVPIKNVSNLYTTTALPENVVLDRLESDEYEGIIKTYAKSENGAEILRMKVFEQRTCSEIAKTVGLSTSRATKEVHGFADYLRRLAEEGTIDLPHLPPKVNKLPFWNDFFSNLEKYRQRFERFGSMLKPSYVNYLEKFFALQTGERDFTLEAIQRALQAEGRYVRKSSIGRGLNSGINQLLYKERSQKRMDQVRQGWIEYQTAKLVEDVMSQDPNTWETFSEQTKYILRRSFVDEIEGRQIARELGVHESTVSRGKDRAIREIYRIKGNPVFNPNLFDKPRHELPK